MAVQSPPRSLAPRRLIRSAHVHCPYRPAPYPPAAADKTHSTPPPRSGDRAGEGLGGGIDLVVVAPRGKARELGKGSRPGQGAALAPRKTGQPRAERCQTRGFTSLANLREHYDP